MVAISFVNQLTPSSRPSTAMWGLQNSAKHSSSEKKEDNVTMPARRAAGVGGQRGTEREREGRERLPNGKGMAPM